MGNKKIETATLKFSEGFNCAQSVVYAFCDDLGLNGETALKIACGFGGGMGRNEEVCGAVSGGILAIGMKYGKHEPDDTTATEITYEKPRQLMGRFDKKTCSHL